MDVTDNQFYKGRSSTRLHAPPGGNTSICFGDEVPLATYARPAFTGANNGAPAGVPAAAAGARPAPAAAAFNAAPAAAFQTPVQQAPAAAAYQIPTVVNPGAAPANQAHTSVRVRQPPGGSSSISFG